MRASAHTHIAIYNSCNIQSNRNFILFAFCSCTPHTRSMAEHIFLCFQAFLPLSLCLFCAPLMSIRSTFPIFSSCTFSILLIGSNSWLWACAKELVLALFLLSSSLVFYKFFFSSNFHEPCWYYLCTPHSRSFEQTINDPVRFHTSIQWAHINDMVLNSFVCSAWILLIVHIYAK